MERELTLPAEKSELKTLSAGDFVNISGQIYVARDAAHKRLMDLIAAGKPLPIELSGETIYYMGPTPARPGRVTGSAGPTTASRMDFAAPTLLDLGLSVMIGKGKRSKEVHEAIIRNGAVYLAAIGGAGAVISKAIEKSEVVCYEDLGAEAIRRLTVKDFPAIVVIDSTGRDLYEEIAQG
ncbi:MAG: Fe-S-containing hydro-lyase [Lachnospiraceae bacterium]|nr:Fe-S-containing hydro-lyase [Lachnospiraceae bacterium]